MTNHIFRPIGCLMLTATQFTWYARVKKIFQTYSQRDGETFLREKNWGDQKEITCSCDLAATIVVLGFDRHLSSWCGGSQTWVTWREAESLWSTRNRRPFLNYNLRDPRSFIVHNFRAAKILFPPSQTEHRNCFCDILNVNTVWASNILCWLHII